MDTHSEIREFLTSRRAKLKAADVGLPDYATATSPTSSASSRGAARSPANTGPTSASTSAASSTSTDAQVGDLQLNYERLEVVLDTGLTIFTYTADPGTRSAEALSLLGSLARTAAAE